MDLRVLEYFLAVVESGNVSKAAQKLHLTQPTLTRQLQQLEEIYGTRLFIRGSRQIDLFLILITTSRINIIFNFGITF